MRFVTLVFLALAVSAVAVYAMRPTPRLDGLLAAADSSEDLRARLFAFADSAERVGDWFQTGAAWYYAGLSFDRGGVGDSAVACYERAASVRGAGEERLALASALLRRQGPGDVARARDVLERLGRETTGEGDETAQGLLAWSMFLAGHADSAAAAFTHVRPALEQDLEWRFRLAQVSLANQDLNDTYRLLWPLAILSRRTDPDVLRMLTEALGPRVRPQRIDDELARAMRERDIAESRILLALRARRASFTGRDGFPLAGVVVADSGKRAQRAAVVLVAAGDTLADYDTLAADLLGEGFATLLLDLRGHGRSVAPFCPLPGTWRGREELMQALCAQDVPLALRALASATRVDTTRYLIVAAGAAAPIAAETAAEDPRVAALLLASPNPSLVERGTMRARLASRTLPLYVLTAPEDILIAGYVDRLYQVSDRRASRVDDASVPGSGATLFNEAPASRARFLRWLRETWAARARRPAPPKAPHTR